MQLSEQDARDFDAFWRAYPRRTAKGDARKAWMQTRAIRPPLPQLIASIEAAKRCEQWRRDGGQYIPYPASWLRAERWDDEHEVQLLTPQQAQPWHATRSGIEAKGRELGVDQQRFGSNFQAFRAAVAEAARIAERGGNVVPLAAQRRA
jgi:hypothetical protein